MKNNGDIIINKIKEYVIKNKIILSIIMVVILLIPIGGGSIYAYNYKKNKELINDFEKYIKDTKSTLSKCVIESKEKQEIDNKFKKSQDIIKSKDTNSINVIKSDIDKILNDILTNNRKLINKSEEEIKSIDLKELSDEDKKYIENELKSIKNNISEKEYKRQMIV